MHPSHYQHTAGAHTPRPTLSPDSPERNAGDLRERNRDRPRRISHSDLPAGWPGRGRGARSGRADACICSSRAWHARSVEFHVSTKPRPLRRRGSGTRPRARVWCSWAQRRSPRDEDDGPHDLFRLHVHYHVLACPRLEVNPLVLAIHQVPERELPRAGRHPVHHEGLVPVCDVEHSHHQEKDG